MKLDTATGKRWIFCEASIDREWPKNSHGWIELEDWEVAERKILRAHEDARAATRAVPAPAPPFIREVVGIFKVQFDLLWGLDVIDHFDDLVFGFEAAAGMILSLTRLKDRALFGI